MADVRMAVLGTWQQHFDQDEGGLRTASDIAIAAGFGLGDDQVRGVVDATDMPLDVEIEGLGQITADTDTVFLVEGGPTSRARLESLGFLVLTENLL
ncbi:MAG: hypothetical protein GWP74_16900 [Proteobacteria bacterium]|nr:hypothetical protein [Pseudomonadota bacterium]